MVSIVLNGLKFLVKIGQVYTAHCHIHIRAHAYVFANANAHAFCILNGTSKNVKS